MWPGLLIGLFISVRFSLLVLIFITMSRLYSYRGVRLKKYPFIGFLTVFIFQGAFVYLMTATAVADAPFPSLFNFGNLVCMAIASLFIGSMYPLTQIYQHQADRDDGVISISYKLGYRGTFLFSAALFVAATALLFYYFGARGQFIALLLFLALISPVVFQLSKWFALVRTDTAHADFENTMKINLFTSVAMNLYFMLLVINNQIAIF